MTLSSITPSAIYSISASMQHWQSSLDFKFITTLSTQSKNAGNVKWGIDNILISFNEIAQFLGGTFLTPGITGNFVAGSNALKDIVCVCEGLAPVSIYQIYDSSTSPLCTQACLYKSCSYPNIRIKTNECTQSFSCVSGICTCENGLVCNNQQVYLSGTETSTITYNNGVVTTQATYTCAQNAKELDFELRYSSLASITTEWESDPNGMTFTFVIPSNYSVSWQVNNAPLLSSNQNYLLSLCTEINCQISSLINSLYSSDQFSEFLIIESGIYQLSVVSVATTSSEAENEKPQTSNDTNLIIAVVVSIIIVVSAVIVSIVLIRRRRNSLTPIKKFKNLKY